MKVLVAGAGIGGLTVALELHARGFEVVLYEAAPEIRTLGVGLNLLPHSARILSDLGLEETLLSRGVATRELVYFNRFGQRIWGEPRGRFAGYPWPQISLTRHQLQATLLEAVNARLGAQALHIGRRLTGFEQNGRTVTATFAHASGGGTETVEADVMIAADGIHSAARKSFYPDEGMPIYAGRILWRGMTRARPFMTGASMIMAGYQDEKFVCYPIDQVAADGLQTINWIAELRRADMPNREDWNRPGKLEDFAAPFESWKFDWLDVPGLIHGAQAIFEFPLVDRDPVDQWSFERVTLLGDAAHPMYPIGSNGASQAILDARAIGEAMSAHSGPVDALIAYEKERQPPTAKIVIANRGNGPEQCMQLVHERAPRGFDNIEDVISTAELEAIAARYKSVAGFSKEALAKKEPV